MRNHFLIILVLMLLHLGASCQSETVGIQFFEGSWEALLAKAKADNKPFFVDVYASWCGPCKVMDKATFKDQNVGNYANKHYLAYKLNAEKGEGPELSRRYRVAAYPTVLFFNAKGELVGRSVGLLYPDDFLAQLEGYHEKATQKSTGMKSASPQEKAALGALFDN